MSPNSSPHSFLSYTPLSPPLRVGAGLFFLLMLVVDGGEVYEFFRSGFAQYPFGVNTLTLSYQSKEWYAGTVFTCSAVALAGLGAAVAGRWWSMVLLVLLITLLLVSNIPL